MKNPKFIHTQFLEDISLCDDMITFFNNNPKLQRKGIANTKRIPRGSTKFKGKISTDITVSQEIKNPHLHTCVDQLQIALDEYLKVYVRANATALFRLSPFNIQRYGPNEGYQDWHCERSQANQPSGTRHLVFLIYLNDIKEGGETEFYYHNFKSKVEKGKVMIWPADWTFTYRDIPTPEEKFIATGWWNFEV